MDHDYPTESVDSREQDLTIRSSNPTVDQAMAESDFFRSSPTTKLCSKCRGIFVNGCPAETTIDDPITLSHHETLRDLEKSIAKGCTLCCQFGISHPFKTWSDRLEESDRYIRNGSKPTSKLNVLFGPDLFSLELSFLYEDYDDMGTLHPGKYFEMMVPMKRRSSNDGM